MYLGLDLSLSNTGIAVITPEGKVLTTLISTKPVDFITKEARISHIASSILTILHKHEIKYITFEGYAFNMKKGRSNNLTDLAELKGVILNQIHLQFPDIVHITVTTQQMKKYVTGQGLIKAPKGVKVTEASKFKKQVVLDAINNLYNLEVTSFDEADAVGLALIGMHRDQGEGITINNPSLAKIQKSIANDVQESYLEDLKKENDRREAIVKRKLKKAKLG